MYLLLFPLSMYLRTFRSPKACFPSLVKHLWWSRSSHQRCSVIKGVLRNFTKFTVKHLCQSQPKACNFIKKRLWYRCFPVNFAKFLSAPFLQNTSGRLLFMMIFFFLKTFLKLFKISLPKVYFDKYSVSIWRWAKLTCFQQRIIIGFFQPRLPMLHESIMFFFSVR